MRDKVKGFRERSGIGISLGPIGLNVTMTDRTPDSVLPMLHTLWGVAARSAVDAQLEDRFRAIWQRVGSAARKALRALAAGLVPTGTSASVEFDEMTNQEATALIERMFEQQLGLHAGDSVRGAIYQQGDDTATVSVTMEHGTDDANFAVSLQLKQRTTDALSARSQRSIRPPTVVSSPASNPQYDERFRAGLQLPMYDRMNCAATKHRSSPLAHALACARATRAGAASVVVVWLVLGAFGAPPALAASGDLDTTFAGDGRLERPEPNIFSLSDVSDADVGSDDSVYAAGQTRDGANFVAWVARLTSAGAMHPTFGGGAPVKLLPPTYTSSQARAIIVQPDLTALVLVSAGGETHVTRLLATGVVDASFGTAGWVTVDAAGGWDDPSSMSRRADGRIIFMVDYSGGAALYGLLATGAPDPAFGVAGVVTLDLHPTQDTFYMMTWHASGIFVTANINGVPTLVRLTQAGALDAGFGTGGVVQNLHGGGGWSRYDHVRIDSVGRIVLGAKICTPSCDIGVVRLTPTGAPDPTFAAPNSFASSYLQMPFYDLLVLPDNRIVYPEYVWTPGLKLRRLDVAGAADATWAPGLAPTPNSSVETVFVRQSTGRIVALGAGDGPAGIEIVSVRFQSTGVPDATWGAAGVRSFEPGTRTGRCGFSSQAPREDLRAGRMIGLRMVSCSTTHPLFFILSTGVGSGHERRFVTATAYLEPTGAVDASWGTAGTSLAYLDQSYFSNCMDRTAQTSTGQVYAFGGCSEEAVLRLTSTGALDVGFGTGGTRDYALPGSGALDMVVDSADRPILLTDGAVARLTTGGVLDPAFGTGGIVTLAGITPQSISVTGTTITVAGSSGAASRVLRLSSTGAPLAGFGVAGVVTIDVDGAVNDVATHAVGRIDGSVDVVGTKTAAPDDRVWITRLSATGAAIPGFGGGAPVVLASFKPGEDWRSARVAETVGSRSWILATSSNDFGVVALVRSTGALDPAFSGDGIGPVLTDVRYATMLQDSAGGILFGSGRTMPAPATRLLGNTTPPLPTLVSPGAGASIIDDTPTFTATNTDPDVGDLGAMDFQLCSNATCTTVSQSNSVSVLGLGSGNWTATTIATGTWWWRVRVTDTWGATSGWSAIRSFSYAPMSISIAAAPGAVPLGLISTGTDVVGSVTATVQTNNPAGYQLTARDTSDANAMTCVCGAIPDWTGTDAAPTVWGAGISGYAGVTVRDAPISRLAKWGPGTGTAQNDYVANRYAGLDATSDVLLHSTAAPTVGDAVVLTYRIDTIALQPAGAYTGTLTLTAVALP